MYNNYNYNPYVNGFNQPNYNQPNNLYPQRQYEPQAADMGLIRVSGMDGAKAYPMPPNKAVALFSNDEDVFYLKTTDGAGFPTIKAYAFKEISEQTQQAANDFVTRQEFEELKAEVMENGKQLISKRANSKQSKPADDERN